MSKNTKPTTTTLDPREILTKELKAIRAERTAARKLFRKQIEDLYTAHRKEMKNLIARRKAAWAAFDATRKTKADAKKAATKKAKTTPKMTKTVEVKPLRKAAAKKDAPVAKPVDAPAAK